MTERRRWPRHNVMLEAEYDADDGYDIQSKTYTLNVSEGGIAIPMNKAIESGKKISLKLRLPYREEEVSACGKVVWKKPLKKNHSNEDLAGIELLEMDEASREKWIEFIKDEAF